MTDYDSILQIQGTTLSVIFAVLYGIIFVVHRRNLSRKMVPKVWSAILLSFFTPMGGLVYVTGATVPGLVLLALSIAYWRAGAGLLQAPLLVLYPPMEDSLFANFRLMVAVVAIVSAGLLARRAQRLSVPQEHAGSSRI